MPVLHIPVIPVLLLIPVIPVLLFSATPE